MTQKRMFSNSITDSDRFYDLPFNSQLLYFHLGMKGDVKGFVEPKKIIRSVGLKIEDMRPLIEAGFVIPFRSGVVVITHWNINNNTRNDREAPTVFMEELRQLSLSDNKYYLLQENSRSTPGVLHPSIEENRIEKNSIVKNREKKFVVNSLGDSPQTPPLIKKGFLQDRYPVDSKGRTLSGKGWNIWTDEQAQESIKRFGWVVKADKDGLYKVFDKDVPDGRRWREVTFSIEEYALRMSSKYKDPTIIPSIIGDMLKEDYDA